MKTDPNRKDKSNKFFPSDNVFLRIFLPMIDDEEQRRLQQLQDEKEDRYTKDHPKEDLP